MKDNNSLAWRTKEFIPSEAVCGKENRVCTQELNSQVRASFSRRYNEGFYSLGGYMINYKNNRVFTQQELHSQVRVSFFLRMNVGFYPL